MWTPLLRYFQRCLRRSTGRERFCGDGTRQLWRGWSTLAFPLMLGFFEPLTNNGEPLKNSSSLK
jgi:hypothetical protein